MPRSLAIRPMSLALRLAPVSVSLLLGLASSFLDPSIRPPGNGEAQDDMTECVQCGEPAHQESDGLYHCDECGHTFRKPEGGASSAPG